MACFSRFQIFVTEKAGVTKILDTILKKVGLMESPYVYLTYIDFR